MNKYSPWNHKIKLPSSAHVSFCRVVCYTKKVYCNGQKTISDSARAVNCPPSNAIRWLAAMMKAIIHCKYFPSCWTMKQDINVKLVQDTMVSSPTAQIFGIFSAFLLLSVHSWMSTRKKNKSIYTKRMWFIRTHTWTIVCRRTRNTFELRNTHRTCFTGSTKNSARRFHRDNREPWNWIGMCVGEWKTSGRGMYADLSVSLHWTRENKSCRQNNNIFSLFSILSSCSARTHLLKPIRNHLFTYQIYVIFFSLVCSSLPFSPFYV